MKIYKKTLWGSILAFFVGTSCCWLTSLAVCFGGIAFIGSIVSLIEDMQVLIISSGIALLVITLFLYVKIKKK